MEKSRSWPSAHDWKSCIPQKGIEGSNPSFSAKQKDTPKGVSFLFGMVFRRRDLKGGSWQHAGGMLQPPGFSAEKQIPIITMKRLPKGRPERCVFFVWHGIQKEGFEGRLLATCRWHVATARLFRRKANPDYYDEKTTKGATRKECLFCLAWSSGGIR